MDAIDFGINRYYDPTISKKTYEASYDYDLLGKPFGWKRLAFDDHLYFIRKFCETQPIAIALVLFGLVLLVLIIFAIADQCAAIPRRVTLRRVNKRDLKTEQQILEDRQKFMQPEDPDRFAAVFCRDEVAKSGATSLHDPIPQDLADYESVRFVFHQPWLTEKTHKALTRHRVETIWDELVEGELEDALMLALREKRLNTRAPLSVQARMAAKQMLAAAEVDLSKDPVVTPEMKLIQGWEDLYRQRIREATEANYRWWLSQGSVLPEEAREVKERLQPIVAQIRKTPTKESNHDYLITQDFKRLPHEEVYDNLLNSREPDMTLEPRIVHQQFVADESNLLYEMDDAEGQVKIAKAKSTKHRKKEKSGDDEKRKNREKKDKKKDK